MDELVAYPRVFMAEVVAVVLLSTLFETWEHWVRHRFAHHGRTHELRILDALFKEVTCLGFIGLLLYLVHRFTIVDTLAAWIFPVEELADENPLFETFELVHMMVFMLLIVLLFQAAALLPVSKRIVRRWRIFERTRAWGLKRESLESMFVEAGYVERIGNPDMPRGLELKVLKPFTYGATFNERMRLRGAPLHQIITWRALRHEFLFPYEQDDLKRTTSAMLRRGVKIAPNPALFSFEGYLRGLLSNTVIALVELDIMTWTLTLLVLMPLMYASLFLACTIEFLQCAIAWLLLAGAGTLAACLEEDIHALTPIVPEDPCQILRLFSGTSFQDFQRQVTPGTDDAGHDIRFGAPGLMGIEMTPKQSIRQPTKGTPEEQQVILSCETYRRLLRLLAFWQAICVTSLLVAFLSHPFHGWSSVVLHCLAWAEWPLMLFWIWPQLVHRLTIRDSVDAKKDVGLIRAVSLHSKEGLLRQHLRLVQVMGFFQRAKQCSHRWTIEPPKITGTLWTRAEAYAAFKRGLHLFKGLSLDVQAEVWELFESLDIDNDEKVGVMDICGKFRAMGFKEHADTAVESILRLVDHDGSQVFPWEKFRAMIALTTAHRPEREVEEDLEMIFSIIDKADGHRVTVFEITEWLRGIKRSLTEGDVAGALHKHFGEAKPMLSKAECMDWFQALANDNEH